MKIIIWGHYPIHTSTHGYIHDTYYKTFKSLGHDVTWVSNEPHNLDYTDAVFFVEDSQKSHMRHSERTVNISLTMSIRSISLIVVFLMRMY